MLFGENAVQTPIELPLNVNIVANIRKVLKEADEKVEEEKANMKGPKE